MATDAGDASIPSLTPTMPDDCRQWLEFYEVDHAPGPTLAGVADPVVVSMPINGVSYRHAASSGAHDSLTMDCTLALSLARAAPLLLRRGIVEVLDLGIYNYRCIGGGLPPDCPRGISEHAHATAIDIAAFVDHEGVEYSFLDDWVVDPEGESTCEAETSGPADSLLHGLVCELFDAGIWNTVLTPNYNAAHRDHVHADLGGASPYLKGIRSGLVAVDRGPDDD